MNKGRMNKWINDKKWMNKWMKIDKNEWIMIDWLTPGILSECLSASFPPPSPGISKPI